MENRTLGAQPSAAMLEAGLKVLEESGLVEGSWNHMPSSAVLAIAEIYKAMDAAWLREAKKRECPHQWENANTYMVEALERTCALCRCVSYQTSSNPPHPTGR